MDGIGYLGILVALLGIILALWAGRGHARAVGRATAARHWRTAPGTILAADAALRGSAVRSSRTAYWTPEIAYSYLVQDRERKGICLAFGSLRSKTEASARRLVAPYPVGSRVQVRYDPDNPDDSVLDPRKPGPKLLLGAVAGAALCLAGLAIVVLAVRGVFSADVSGHWHVSFAVGGAQYEGDFDSVRGSGPLVLTYTAGQPVRVREDCTMARTGRRGTRSQHVTVACANAQVLQGTAAYSPDRFELEFQDANTLTGTLDSTPGSGGRATFTR